MKQLRARIKQFQLTSLYEHECLLNELKGSKHHKPSEVEEEVLSDPINLNEFMHLSYKLNNHRKHEAKSRG